MKNLLTLLFVLCSVSVFADVNRKDAVTMENFEQRWSDFESTIALKNNTNERIYNVAYRITYLDMNGKALDYSDYTSTIDIDPGMVKKINIPAYERDRSYQYYKNAENYVDKPKFKVSFELEDYNFEDDLKEETNDEDEHLSNVIAPSLTIMILIILFAILIFVISIGLYILTAIMAKHRHRNVALWVIISILATPIFAIIILLCVGDSGENNYPNG